MTDTIRQNITIISKELSISNSQASAVVKLLDEGATVPFIARYRKEAIGALDETVILRIKDRVEQLAELDKRRNAILKSLSERNLLNKEIESQLFNASSLIELEDIYLPYKPKKRTRAAIAREKGLEELADIIFSQLSADIYNEAKRFINPEKGVISIEDAIEGAKDIVAERVSENIECKNELRQLFRTKGVVYSKLQKSKEEEAAKFEDYFEYDEEVARIPSHRILAIFRGNNEGFLSIKVRIPEETAMKVMSKCFLKNNTPSEEQMKSALEDSYKRLLLPSIETEILNELKELADTDSIKIFARNLKELLLQPPLASKRVMALDPGFRTGVKLVCLGKCGELLHFDTIYPFNSTSPQLKDAEVKIKTYCNKFSIEAIAIGNGTAGKETETFIRSLGISKEIIIVMVNESGASIYSASETARKEFPNHDITVRGAVSIGRRLIDPLAELVKIDPKSIGVGQYQHDVDQQKLKKELGNIVESCVNSVGVDLNTASAELLEYVSGLGPVLAKNIVDYRDKNGRFSARDELKKVSRLGAMAFQQSAGFLRIQNAENPLDGSAVHPESYYIVEKMASDAGCNVKDLIEKPQLRKAIDLKHYITDQTGLPTLQDIMSELEKPGRDPRKKFEVFSFTEGINKIEDLKIGMTLQGIVTNVTRFGAFIDIGVHQDGLLHISEMADRYVADPNEILKAQQKVKVKVLGIDLKKKRISLSMKSKPA
ncbi:MAG TPA: RNA-binding transcriptional accessory protein [Lentisphaeria bacterium]|nr:MAG: RNA-binding transcriptional accessory protein [Lentisphaerae bacterium GWF2_38_69]HBM15814.1 RNA-binding transcriptional accessory protein [Lentisphaeria bacterium]